MNRKRWLACTDPGMMLSWQGDRLSPRKRQLFACACVRRVWDRLNSEVCRRAVEVAERHADGLATDDELSEADEALDRGNGDGTPSGEADLAASFAILARLDYAGRDPQMRHPADNAVRFAAEVMGGDAEPGIQAAILRDIAGPWRSRPVGNTPSIPAGNEGFIVHLAEAAYEDRRLPSGPLDPVRLAVLADALEEAGADSEMVEHLRGPGPHVRGCWVLDILTGRE
jgi:hypothetical protein